LSGREDAAACLAIFNEVIRFRTCRQTFPQTPKLPEPMATHQIVCPSCAGEVTVSEDQAGMVLACPHCGLEFELEAATPDNSDHQPLALPEKVPFFKASRKRILKEHMDHLSADGTLSESDKRHLAYLTANLKLSEEDANSVQGELFMEHWRPIQQRLNSTMYLNDADVAELEELGKRFGVKITQEESILIARQRWMMDQKGILPKPLGTSAAMLSPKENAYWEIPSTWHQIRSVSKGYVGGSVGIRVAKGVRLSLGRAIPVRRQELTPLSAGTLTVTDKRLLLQGGQRSTTILLSRITSTEIFKEGLMIHKDRGVPDLFSMSVIQSAFLDSLIRLLVES
jgi:hypothetical protein